MPGGGGSGTQSHESFPDAGDLLAGVALVPLIRHADDRGSFTEVFADHWESGIAPSQWSIVRSEAGVLRGMHMHQRHDEYFHVVTGRASVGLHDLRPSSPSYGRWARFDLGSDDDLVLVFPRGLVHGWLFHEPTVHLQAVSESYVDYALDDNNGCAWDAAGLGIEWPFEPTELSERARTFGSLDDLRRVSSSA